MKLEFPPYETVVPTPIGTRVSSLWNYSANPYWHYSLSPKKLQRLPNRLPINYDKQVESVVRDSCGTELSRLCGLSLLSLLLEFKFGRTILL